MSRARVLRAPAAVAGLAVGGCRPSSPASALRQAFAEVGEDVDRPVDHARHGFDFPGSSPW